MKRKVIKHGPSTFIISLPSTWCKKNNIKKGDELDVDEEEGHLTISTEQIIQRDLIDIDISSLDRSSLMYVIRCLYKKGYEEIILRFDNQKVKHLRLDKERTIVSVIYEELNRMTGIEIIEQKTNSCTLKTLSEMKFVEFRSIQRRIFLLIIDMFHDLVQGYESEQLLLKNLEDKHNGITKFISFCMRLLNTRSPSTEKNNPLSYAILSHTDKIVDSIKHGGRIVRQFKPKPSKKTVSMMKKILKSIELYYDFYYAYDNDKIQDQSSLRDGIIKEVRNEYDSFSKEDLLLVSNLMPIVENIYAMIEHRIAMEF